MSRPSYLQEQLLYQQHHPAANIKRLRQQALPIYGRSYSLEEQTDGHFVPVYSKFIYPQQQQLHPQQLLHRPLGLGLQDSLNSLNSDFTDYDYGGGAYILEEQPPPAAASTEHVVRNLNALGRLLELLQRWPLPRLSFNTACICSLIIIFIAPRSCAQSLLFPAFRLFFGTLYPAYASYKAVRTKNVKEYVKWMMYWIVFAFFTCIETFTDIFLSWFPFYYEVKVVIVLWLLSPATKGSSTLYRKFVHPMLTRREQEIDEYLNQARERGYSAVLQLGSKGVNYATNVIMQTAIKTINLTTASVADSRGLQNSRSANELSRDQDMLDATDLLLPRSSSLSGIESYSSQRMVISEFNEDLIIAELSGEDAGAARLRDMPLRKTRSTRGVAADGAPTTAAAAKRATRGAPKTTVPKVDGIKGRRRLREATPDVDVEGD
ncbi:receptor expression-enhancing protein 2 isoform X5 [Drosophila albomicans]|uniref:Receptor expression-enhancing protein 2 isoform X5 n=1 Tax=Drosophila albomicans TaxID=7291 RepID=A0A6P8Z427_DROAB|nr:receptor expression-enhancing protein 2 isoform X5 [Drosophila albomicans]